MSTLAPITVDPKTAAKMIGVGIVTLYSLLASGRIPAAKLGKRTLIRVSDIDNFLNELPSYKSERAA